MFAGPNGNLQLIRRASHLAQIAIERTRTEENLRRSENHLNEAQR